jgi:hypothetical protein
MANDYTPVYIVGEIVTATASTAVTAADILEVSGSSTVRTCLTAGSLKMVGVAQSDTVINGRVSYYCRGAVHESVAQGVITAGDQLITGDGTGGKQVKTCPPSGFAVGYLNTDANTQENNTRGVIGFALTSAADGGKVRWMIV